MPELTLSEAAELARGELRGDAARVVRRVRPLSEAGPDDLTFVANARYAEYLQGTRAGGVLLPAALAERAPASVHHIVVADAHLALAAILDALYPPTRPAPGVHASASVAEDAVLGDGVAVGAGAVVESGARIGAGAVIGPTAVVGRDCVVGRDSVVHAGSTLYAGTTLGERCIIHSGVRLGVDGFGYAWDGERHRKIPQVGGCVLGDEVEIGANSTVDRGSIGDTVIGSGTKIDNLVHIGHNCRIGEKVIIIAQVGISGSTSVGDGAILAGQAGVGGHLTIGAGARVGAQAGVTGDVAPGETVSGYPARPHREAMRASAALFKLPDLIRRMRKIEKVVMGRSD